MLLNLQCKGFQTPPPRKVVQREKASVDNTWYWDAHGVECLPAVRLKVGYEHMFLLNSKMCFAHCCFAWRFDLRRAEWCMCRVCSHLHLLKFLHARPGTSVQHVDILSDVLRLTIIFIIDEFVGYFLDKSICFGLWNVRRKCFLNPSNVSFCSQPVYCQWAVRSPENIHI